MGGKTAAKFFCLVCSIEKNVFFFLFVSPGLLLDAGAAVWIAKGTPLPTRVVIHCPTNNSSTTIWQLEPQTTKLARVEETYQELVLELSADGELSITVDGQQPVTVSNQ